MKTSFLLIILFLFGCTHSGTKSVSDNQSVIVKSQSPIKKRETLTKEQTGNRKSEIDESLLLNNMMRDILVYAYKHANASSYRKELNNWGYEPAVTSATVTFGHIFDKSKKHLIVTRSISGSVINVDVFLLKESKFHLVCSKVLDNLTYLDDTIKDVDGDHQKDFLIHWYPSAGCCERDIYGVYLYQKDKGNFTSAHEFINPTFSPSEKIIRGVGYGHPGDVELYKYKWNGLKVDTIEFIFPDTLTKKFHVYKHENDFDNPKAGKYLTAVPKEYHKIESYDWFEGDY